MRTVTCVWPHKHNGLYTTHQIIESLGYRQIVECVLIEKAGADFLNRVCSLLTANSTAAHNACTDGLIKYRAYSPFMNHSILPPQNGTVNERERERASEQRNSKTGGLQMRGWEECWWKRDGGWWGSIVYRWCRKDRSWCSGCDAAKAH